MDNLTQGYIHYHYVNYLRFGISSPEGQTKSKAFDYVEKRKEMISKLRIEKRLDSSLDKGTIRKLERYTENILNPSNTESPFFKKANKALEEHINKEVGRRAEDIRLAPSGKAVFSSEVKKEKNIKTQLVKSNQLASADKLNNFKIKTSQQRVTIDKLERALTSLYQYANNYIKKASEGDLRRQQIEEVIRQIDNIIEQALGSISQQSSPVQASFSNYIKTLQEAKKSTISIQDNINIINLLNELVILLKSPNVSVINGNVLEQAMKIVELRVNENIEDIGEEKIMQALNSAMTGKKQESTHNRERAERLNNFLGVEDLDFSIFESSSSIKADFILTVPNAEKKQNLSIKNYNLKSQYNIKLVEDTPFTSMLAEDLNFAAHFLNMASVRPNELKGTPTVPYSVKLKEANAALRVTLFWSALKGNSDRTQVSYFLINDNSTSKKGSVRIVSVYEIMDQIMKQSADLDKLFKVVILTLNGKDLVDNVTSGMFSQQNNWLGDINTKSPDLAKKRTSLIMAEAHTKNLTVALKPQLMKQFFNK
ncbi:MAG: hypothetical protein IJZ77_02780 [Bacilli bacterium]|nr:hypothetical protein [Bacilli bacterium]